MKKLLVLMTLAVAVQAHAVTEDQVEKAVRPSLEAMMCLGFALGVHTAMYQQEPNDKQYRVYDKTCHKTPKEFMAYLELKAKGIK